ncbi:biliverdin-producing heme oxygenase [Nocardia sp. NBC_01730]|uniref:biliverdin-producing heme oxygenase n=1 Tax=Nocardia sp. NBC_01730 TaxID=2975998 RepID=UPI002E125774|nr:biliverdin-producing heme oxygenase [Nocardia sp. NBC_01730]
MIMKRLRAETRAWHDALEATPFSLELLSRTLLLGRYVGQLRAYRIILDTLETRLADSDDPIVTAVWRSDLAKVPLLEQDLEFFDTVPADAIAATAITVADRFAAVISDCVTKDPVSLLGFLYVMEGSTMGGLELTPHVRATFGLADGRGLTYYSSGDRQRWTAFATRMDEAVVDEPLQQLVLAAADKGYRAIADTLAALSRPDREESTPGE